MKKTVKKITGSLAGLLVGGIALIIVRYTVQFLGIIILASLGKSDLSSIRDIAAVSGILEVITLVLVFRKVYTLIVGKNNKQPTDATTK